MEWCDANGMQSSEEDQTTYTAVGEHGCAAVRFTAQTDMDTFQAWLPSLVHTFGEHGGVTRYIFISDFLAVFLQPCSLEGGALPLKFTKKMVTPTSMFWIFYGTKYLKFDKTVGAKSPFLFARMAREALIALPEEDVVRQYFRLNSDAFAETGQRCSDRHSVYNVLAWGHLSEKPSRMLGPAAMLEYLHSNERGNADWRGSEEALVEQRGEIENIFDDASLFKPRLQGIPERDVTNVASVLQRLFTEIPIQFQIFRSDTHERRQQLVRSCEYLDNPAPTEAKLVRHFIGENVEFLDAYPRILTAVRNASSSSDIISFIATLQRAAASTRGCSLMDLKELNYRLRDQESWLGMQHVKQMATTERIDALEARLRESIVLSHAPRSSAASGSSNDAPPQALTHTQE